MPAENFNAKIYIAGALITLKVTFLEHLYQCGILVRDSGAIYGPRPRQGNRASMHRFKTKFREDYYISLFFDRSSLDFSFLITENLGGHEISRGKFDSEDAVLLLQAAGSFAELPEDLIDDLVDEKREHLIQAEIDEFELEDASSPSNWPVWPPPRGETGSPLLLYPNKPKITPKDIGDHDGKILTGFGSLIFLFVTLGLIIYYFFKK